MLKRLGDITTRMIKSCGSAMVESLSLVFNNRRRVSGNHFNLSLVYQKGEKQYLKKLLSHCSCTKMWQNI